MTAEAGAREFRMALSDRGQAAEESGDLADARRIQSVLFGTGRAGDTRFGVDVTSYLMEISDEATLSELRSRAQEAIARNLPGVQVNALFIELIPSATEPAGRGTNSLAIGVSLGVDEANSFPFVLAVSPGRDGGLVSRLVL